MRVSGSNIHSQLDSTSNNKSINDHTPIISPFKQLNIENVSSFSTYQDHTVMITNNGELYALGYNRDGRITNSLQTEGDLTKFTKFELKNDEKSNFIPISAVCGYDFTLYLVTKKDSCGENYLLYSCSNNKESPLFLNIENSKPVSLFGGYTNAAAIDDNGSIILIPENIRYSPSNELQSFCLPDNEKAVSVACCNSNIYALSSSGKVYVSETDPDCEYAELCFEEVEELDGIKITEISGTFNHCFAVSENGKVYGCGYNSNGELCLDTAKRQYYSFIEITSLKDYNIQNAYAGFSHSLFQTVDGKIITCGCNNYGELLGNGPSKDNVCCPKETDIKEGAKFCIAGENISVVFMDSFPLNCPNCKINNIKDSINSHKKLLNETDTEKVSKSVHNL